MPAKSGLNRDPAPPGVGDHRRGGTAGHVHPGLAVARALVRRGHERESIHFVGSARGIERDLVPAAGFELTLLPGRGIERRLSWQSVSSAWALAQAVAQATGLLRRLQPEVVLGLGGYASVPCALAARLLRIPVVVAEQNAVPGLANRLAARWARACAVSFSGTNLPRSVLTGNPVRDEVQEVDRQAGRSAARTALGVGEGRRLLVVASGSLGAARINRAAFEAARHWSDRGDLAIHHVVGVRDWRELAHLRPDLDGACLDYRAVEYEDDMATVYAAADLVVGRAGLRVWPNWQWSVWHRCWCRCRGPPAITRRPTPPTWRQPEVPWWCPTQNWTVPA